MIGFNRGNLPFIRIEGRSCQIGNLYILFEILHKRSKILFLFLEVNFRVAKQGRESPTIIIIGPEDFSDLTREHYLRLISYVRNKLNSIES